MTINEMIEAIEAISAEAVKLVKENHELKKRIKELEDKVEMLDFFYEGNGFKSRGLNNSIQIANYISDLEEQLTKAVNP